MSFSDFVNDAIVMTGMSFLQSKWMKIDDVTTLRYTIRSDVRQLDETQVRALGRLFETAIQGYTATREHDLRNKAVMVREIVREELGG